MTSFEAIKGLEQSRILKILIFLISILLKAHFRFLKRLLNW